MLVTGGGVVLGPSAVYDGTDQTNSFQGASNPPSWALVYNFGKEDAVQLAEFVTSEPTTNWGNMGNVEFTVIRNKDTVTTNVKATINANSYDEDLMINLQDAVVTQKFSGNQFIGFGFYSQQGAFESVSLRLGLEDWIFKYPFQIWKDWINRQDVSLFSGVNCTQTLSNGQQVDFTKEFVSPIFELGDYDENKSGMDQPYALRTPESMQFYNTVTGDQVGTILNDVPTRVVATFRDENLNDLESGVVSFPTVMTIANTGVGNLTGYFGITSDRNLQSEYLRFHNIRDNSLTTLWTNIPAGETNQATLTIVDIQTATLEAIIQPDGIRERFGNNFNCLNITARLDKFQTNT